MASTITIPAPGYAPQALITLATQAQADSNALEGAVGAAVTAESVGSALSQSASPIDFNAQPVTEVGGIVFTGGFSASISCAEAASTTHALTITGQNLNSESSGDGGNVVITSGAKAGAGTDGTITLDSLASSVYVKNGASVGNTFAFSGTPAGTGTCSLSMLQDDATLSAVTKFTLSAGAAEVMKAEANKLGFFGAVAVTKPDVTGIRGTNAGLASLLTALATLGLITDSTTES